MIKSKDFQSFKSENLEVLREESGQLLSLI